MRDYLILYLSILVKQYGQIKKKIIKEVKEKYAEK